MKNKLVELCRQAHRAYLKEDDAPADFSQYMADYLIASGVIVPPCKIGDTVWLNRNFHSKKIPQKGIVSEMHFMPNMDIQIVVKYIGRGTWGKEVFSSQEQAKMALERGKKG